MHMHIHMQTVACGANNAFAVIMRRYYASRAALCQEKKTNMTAVIVTAWCPFATVLPVIMNSQTINIATSNTMAMCMCMPVRGALLRSVS